MTAPLSLSLLLLTFLLLLLSLTLVEMLLVVVVHIISDIATFRALKIVKKKMFYFRTFYTFFFGNLWLSLNAAF